MGWETALEKMASVSGREEVGAEVKRENWQGEMVLVLAEASGEAHPPDMVRVRSRLLAGPIGLGAMAASFAATYKAFREVDERMPDAAEETTKNFTDWEMEALREAFFLAYPTASNENRAALLAANKASDFGGLDLVCALSKNPEGRRDAMRAVKEKTLKDDEVNMPMSLLVNLKEILDRAIDEKASRSIDFAMAWKKRAESRASEEARGTVSGC
jgi:hypothetical protein